MHEDCDAFYGVEEGTYNVGVVEEGTYQVGVEEGTYHVGVVEGTSHAGVVEGTFQKEGDTYLLVEGVEDIIQKGNLGLDDSFIKFNILLYINKFYNTFSLMSASLTERTKSMQH
jgi:hypothetical protein